MKARLGTLAAAALLAVSLGGGAPRAAATLPAALAFSRSEAAGGGVFVWERSGRVRLFAREGVSPAWSPDGRRLAYVQGAELWVADADGSHRARLSRPDGGEAASPAWAPDGRSLVVERSGMLVVVRADGAHERVLTAGSEPAWSSRGRIAFVRDGDLYDVGSNGRGSRRLTASAAFESAPAWSPDGRRLVFVSTDGAATDLYVLEVAGRGGVRQLTADPFAEGSPAWSADGSTIAFVSNQTGVEAPWTIAGAGGPAALLSGVSQLGDLRWRPSITRELRPDLEQQAPSKLTIETVTRSGKPRFLLGFRSATDNVGEGPLSVLAFRTSPALPTMQASQRVRLIGGGIRTYPRVGFLRYTYSASHNHWHLMGFQRYELRRAGDHRLVGSDRKSGFCLTDRWGNAAHGFDGRRRRPVFTDYCQREGTDALFVSQGTSIGYSDVYPAHFHGQNIDVTRVPAGTYVLVHRASPDLLIREQRYENNAASLRIRLSWPQGRSSAPAIRVLRQCPASERCP
ncbi:MAG: lysyl oxidase family protein [Gaiellaceae bacterium]